ncbi:MAG: TetR/AcrR family transcriptional regulator [Thermodesulfobacteriota bacterium]|nr:TetR/AcrR family transcriptional regulator [Thermodesulfobacteriota bacterium]
MNIIKDIPLRERKRARVRLALLDAAIERMREKALADITVEELCEEVEVSKGTFFRHFPRKTDLILYYIRLWSIESSWHAQRIAGSSPGLAAIEALFEWTAVIFEDHPRLFAELVAFRAFEPQELEKLVKNEKIMVTQSERLLRFPDLDGIESIPEGTFHNIFRDNLIGAVANSQLPDNIDIDQAVLSLACIFYGVPLMLADIVPKNLAAAYSHQVRLLWTGLKGSGG